MKMQDYWPGYVREHRHRLTRRLHFIGTTNCAIWLALALARRRPRYLLIGIISSYAFAWTGHFFVERNTPATWRSPWQASLGDLRMYLEIWRGTMEAEVDRYAGRDPSP